MKINGDDEPAAGIQDTGHCGSPAPTDREHTPRTRIPVPVNDDRGHGETIPVLGLMSPHYSNIAPEWQSEFK